jgi:hypothetical protein
LADDSKWITTGARRSEEWVLATLGYRDIDISSKFDFVVLQILDHLEVRGHLQTSLHPSTPSPPGCHLPPTTKSQLEGTTIILLYGARCTVHSPSTLTPLTTA